MKLILSPPPGVVSLQRREARRKERERGILTHRYPPQISDWFAYEITISLVHFWQGSATCRGLISLTVRLSPTVISRANEGGDYRVYGEMRSGAEDEELVLRLWLCHCLENGSHWSISKASYTTTDLSLKYPSPWYGRKHTFLLVFSFLPLKDRGITSAHVKSDF